MQPVSGWRKQSEQTKISTLYLGRLPRPNSMNFRKTMLRCFREAQKFATKFIRIGVTPHPFPKIHHFYPHKMSEKNATKFFGSEMILPFQKFSENSLNLVQVMLPKGSTFTFSVTSIWALPVRGGSQPLPGWFGALF